MSRCRARLSRRVTVRPVLEQFEGRLVPATHTWTGAAGDLWSDDANWDGGSPAGDPEADLVFPGSAANIANRNDLVGLAVHSLAFRSLGDPTYTIAGNPLTLTGGGIHVGLMIGPHTIACDLVLTADLTITMDSTPFNTGRLEIRGAIRGEHGLVLDNGWLLLSGASTYTGETRLERGVVHVASRSPFGTGHLTLNGASLFARTGTIPNPFTVARTVSIASEYSSLGFTGPGVIAAGASIRIGLFVSVSLTGNLSGEGSVVIQTGDMFQLVRLGGVNTYTGGTDFMSGTLQLASATALPPGTAFRMAGARFDLNGFDATLDSLAGGGTVLLTDGSLTVGGDNTSTSYSGVISGSGGVAKVGSGTWTLSGGSSFLGGLTVADGVVSLGGARAAGTGRLYVAGGALNVAAAVEAPGGVTNASSVVIGPGRALRTTYYEQTAGFTYLLGGTLAAEWGVSIGEGSYFGGSGVVAASVWNGGMLDVGGAGEAGELRITGDYVQAATGSLRVELGDFAAGQYDRLEVAGGAYLDGVLDVVLLEGFFAEDGQAFEVFRFAGRDGDFAGVNLPELGGGYYLDPVFDPLALTLYVVR